MTKGAMKNENMTKMYPNEADGRNERVKIKLTRDWHKVHQSDHKVQPKMGRRVRHRNETEGVLMGRMRQTSLASIRRQFRR